MFDSSKRLACVASLAAAAVPVIAAGCGSSDSNDTTESTQATTEASTGTAPAGASSKLAVSETDFKLTPADPTVKAGTVTIDATNDGQTQHSIEVEGPNGEKRLTTPLEPGQKGSLEVDLSKPGTYEWYCPIDGHKDMGMKGEITVK